MCLIKLFRVAALISLMAFNFGCSQPVFAAKNSEAVALMPMPQQVKMTPGSYQLNEQINIELKGFSEARANFHRNRLQTHLSRISQKRIALQDVSDIAINKNVSANIRVIVAQAETSPTHVQFAVDESYQLTVNEEGITVTANTVFGAQHGLTTLTQLAYANSQQPLSVPYTEIQDSPRFKWRGLLIDSVRHFISLETIKRQLDGMAAAKLNVFHWHLTDDQGWRIESKRYPKLTEKASDGLFYTQAEVKDVIAYANLLGIRVVPEFGMPGHASAIAVAYPEFMAQQKQYEMERHWGVFKPLLDISSPKAYEFAENLISEMTAIFHDKYFHIGGDEVEPEHWLENENIQNLMVQQGLKDGHDLQNYFNQKIQPIIAKHDRIMVGWDEIFHPQLPDNILVQSWRGHDSLNQVANAGYKGVLSTGFYIDQPQYSDYHYRNDPLSALPEVDLSQQLKLSRAFTIDRLKGSDIKGELIVLGEQVLIKLNNNHHQLAKVQSATSSRMVASMDSWMGPLTFEFNLTSHTDAEHSAVMIGNSRYPVVLSSLYEPSKITLSEPLSAASEKNILGAEATIWSEMVTDENLDLRIWPRLFVISERLWSAKTLNDSDFMYRRLSTVDRYAGQVIGLKHKQQKLKGFHSMLKQDVSDELKKQSFSYLLTLSEMLEPSHYYTRHHIKFLKDEYHQLAALDSFVDYLPVESRHIRVLNNQVNAYLEGDNSALDAIEQQLKYWQMALHKQYVFFLTEQSVSLLQQTIAKLKQFTELGLSVISQCKKQTKQPKLAARLLALQSLEDELVIAGIYPIRQLSMHCAENKR